MSFGKNVPADLFETTIATAVKDWLKLSTHRYNYGKKKNNK